MNVEISVEKRDIEGEYTDRLVWKLLPNLENSDCCADWAKV